MLGITRVPHGTPIGENEGIRIIITEGGKKALKQGAVGGIVLGMITSFAVKRALTGRIGVVQTAAEVAQDNVSP